MSVLVFDLLIRGTFGKKMSKLLGSVPMVELAQYFLESTRIFSKSRKNWKGKRKPVKPLTEDEQLEKEYGKLRNRRKEWKFQRGKTGGRFCTESGLASPPRSGANPQPTHVECCFCGTWYANWSTHRPECGAPKPTDEQLWEDLFGSSTNFESPTSPISSSDIHGSPTDTLETPGARYFCSCGVQVDNEFARCKDCIDMIILTEKLEKQKRDNKQKRKRKRISIN
jgi:hypothetical protein